MITVVPVRLIRSSSSMIPSLVSGSRLPVGSSASSTRGRLTNARAIATRCCSPPESSCGSRVALPSRPTISSTSGTTRLIVRCGLFMTSSGKGVFRGARGAGEQAEVLEAAADRAAQLRPLPLAHRVQRFAVDADRARRRRVLLEQESQERRLARSRGPDEEDELPLVDLGRHVIEGGTATGRVQLGDMLQFDHEWPRYLANLSESPNCTNTRVAVGQAAG